MNEYKARCIKVDKKWKKEHIYSGSQKTNNILDIAALASKLNTSRFFDTTSKY